MPDTTALRTMMVDTQIRPSDVTKFPIIDAMLSVPRENFVPSAARGTAYSDGPVAMGEGRSILEPRSLAKMLDALDLQSDEMVLIVGAGLGYSAAVTARMTEAVVALEEDTALAQEAEAQLAASETDNVAFVTGPLVDGAAKFGPFDVILIDGGIEELPTAIMEQLKDGGRVAAIFVDGPMGNCRIGLKTGGQLSWRDTFDATADVLPGFRKAPAFQL